MVNNKSNSVYLKVKDFSVSGEEFNLIKNKEYGFLETVPQPSPDKLADYYISEDYISHTDSKRNLFEKLYHLVKKVSLNKKVKLINSFSFNEKKLLDIGCGTGDFLLVAKKNEWIVSGIEPNKQARDLANNKTNNCVFDTDYMLKFKSNSFDVITLWHVLEHLPDLEKQIAVIKKLLKPNGIIIIAVPNYKSFDAKYYKRFWAAFDVPRHLWHFSKSSISKLVNKQRLEVIKIKPMFFDSFYVSMLSEKYKTGKMNFIKSFFIGILSNINFFITKEASSLIFIIKKP